MAGESHTLRLSFAAGTKSLTVREFDIREALSRPFELWITALSPNADVPIGKLIGTPVDFYLTSNNPTAPERVWSGIVAEMMQTYAAIRLLGSDEQSEYRIRIVPHLWLLSQWRDSRIFQQQSIPDIVKKILAERNVSAEWNLTRGDEHYPKKDYVVQYGESYLRFIERLCEDAGITYLFRFPNQQGPQKLCFVDQPEKGAVRGGTAIQVLDQPAESAPPEFLVHVTVRQQSEPGVATVRDYEFRKQHNFPLLAKGEEGALAPEDFAEQYSYEPGVFLVDSKEGPATPIADDRGMQPRHDSAEGKRVAARRIAALRADRRAVSFQTNCPDLAPGVLFKSQHHPRPEIAGPLLVTQLELHGTAVGDWSFQGVAAFVDHPWLPDRKTEKPRIHGTQSAIVVGAKGAKNPEIHSDEHGRVRVQFHWDRDGKYDDKSSCWLRVSQDWAGAGYGVFRLPRVGQEVLVAFYEGDPDQPVVIGSVYNELNPVPYQLPKHKTKSTWKSDASPNKSDERGFNELMFEDKGDSELVYQQAERDLQKLVKKYETERTGVDRLAIVGGERRAVLGELEAVMAGKRWFVEAIDPPSESDLKIQEQEKPTVKPTDTIADAIDKRIIFTTGKASVTFEDKNIRIQADGSIKVKAAGADCIIEGKHVYINTKEPTQPATPDPFDLLEPSTFGYVPRTKPGEFQPAEMRALAKAPGNRPEQIAARKQLAYDFYSSSHYQKWDRDTKAMRPLTHDEKLSEMKGTDFNEPVIVGPHHKDKIPGALTQWQAPGGSRGAYFAHDGTQPAQLGIADLGRAPSGAVAKKTKVTYAIDPSAPYMQSTAAPAADFWSLGKAPPGGKWAPTRTVQTPAGGTQYITPAGRDASSPLIKAK
jgi:type VI secretion system secreted protein VgrG